MATPIYVGDGDSMEAALRDVLHKIEAALPPATGPFAHEVADWVLSWLNLHMMLTGAGRAIEAKNYLKNLLADMKAGKAIDDQAAACLGYTVGEPRTKYGIHCVMNAFFEGCKMGMSAMEHAKSATVITQEKLRTTGCTLIEYAKLE